MKDELVWPQGKKHEKGNITKKCVTEKWKRKDDEEEKWGDVHTGL